MESNAQVSSQSTQAPRAQKTHHTKRSQETHNRKQAQIFNRKTKVFTAPLPEDVKQASKLA